MKYQEVTCGLLASSAQPSRAASFLILRPSLPPPPQPTTSASFFDIPGALPEGLWCFTAFRPLPVQDFFSGKDLEALLR
jgi:hypothetical protein